MPFNNEIKRADDVVCANCLVYVLYYLRLLFTDEENLVVVVVVFDLN